MTGSPNDPRRQNSSIKPFGFPSEHRIRSQQDFDAIYAAKQRAGDQNLLLFAIRNDLPQTRLGLSVSKKNGNAIKRARKKRLLREAFRLIRSQLPAGLDLIAIPRADQDGDLKGYQKSLKYLSQKLKRRLEQQSG
ncbi:ribonuclease P protein component [Gimesia algae]|uniref:Ribonuclease P protein component n=1 Tax=Gimesia algae TaxID=2527971 RepID=A0A517VH13_9PLAN|nr:ribonuclease P protein component [Gimesia algae]QDT92308.1 Ribonuclease P protein component [Gimesia algae]